MADLRGAARDHCDLAQLDYTESLALLTALEREGALQGTDAETLRDARAELEKLTQRTARAAVP